MLDSEPVVAEIRRFNRFYTRRIGLLNHTLTQSPFTLAEARVLFEIGHAAGSSAGTPEATASDIAEQLRLDPAYLARILKRFGKLALVDSRPDPRDARRRLLSLTAAGHSALSDLQAASNRDLAGVTAALSDRQSHELVDSLRKAAILLGDAPDSASTLPDIHLRPHEIGDVGWVIERQSRLYAREHGWNQEYEALVCEIGASFLRKFQPGKEFCWIAEAVGMRVGAVFLIRRNDEEAQLRMLHVEQEARGRGVGGLLIRQCVETARAVGYGKLLLWTNDVLVDARRLYERAGFQLISQEGHNTFGHELHGQTWQLDL